MNRIDLAARSTEPEQLDTHEFSGPLLALALHDIARFNRWLGGHRSLIRGVKRALPWLPRGPLKVVDIGCGSGDGLRALARWGVANNITLELHGIDANPEAIALARKCTSRRKINYVVGDAFGQTLRSLQPDIVVANQFFHHFTSCTLESKLPVVLASTRALLMCDLHRHPLAHAGFGALARVSGASPVAHHDGLVSIRRGFTRRELAALVASIPHRHHSIEWCFPFRYEVLIVP